MEKFKKIVKKDLPRRYSSTYVYSDLTVDCVWVVENKTGLEFTLSRKEMAEAYVDYIENKILPNL